MRKNVGVVLALFFCTTLIYARTDHKKSKVAVLRQDERVRLCYESPSKSTVEVSITDNDGNELFNEKINVKNFIRPYDFSNLPWGNYIVSVKDDSGEHIEKIQFYDRAYLGHVAKLEDGENRFLVTIPKMGTNEVAICVYDQEDNLVFTEIADHYSDYAKVYNLKNFNGASIEIFDRD